MDLSTVDPFLLEPALMGALTTVAHAPRCLPEPSAKVSYAAALAPCCGPELAALCGEADAARAALVAALASEKARRETAEGAAAARAAGEAGAWFSQPG